MYRVHGSAALTCELVIVKAIGSKSKAKNSKLNFLDMLSLSPQCDQIPHVFVIKILESCSRKK